MHVLQELSFKDVILVSVMLLGARPVNVSKRGRSGWKIGCFAVFSLLHFHVSGKTVVARDLYLSCSNSCGHRLLGMTPQVSLLLAAVQGSCFHMDEVFLSNFSNLLSMSRLLLASSRQHF